MNCPICSQDGVKRECSSRWELKAGEDSVVGSYPTEEVCIYTCSLCGRFILERCDQNDHVDNRDRLEGFYPYRLSALLREQHLRGLPPLWVRFRDSGYLTINANISHAPIHVGELLDRWPRTVGERLDRALCNLARVPKEAGESIRNPRGDSALLFARSQKEAVYHVNSLTESKFIKRGADADSVVVTTSGWAKVDELERKRSSPTNPAFVAMWFGGKDPDTMAEMAAMYEKGIAPAVKLAGYFTTRVDREEHADFIMDKIISLIRVAPFVVADFTSNNRGVYFEAGYARGLNVTTIHTCKKSDADNIHFDVKQINTIRWTTPEGLAEQLYYRILGIHGQGPHRPDTQDKQVVALAKKLRNPDSLPDAE